MEGQGSPWRFALLMGNEATSCCYSRTNLWNCYSQYFYETYWIVLAQDFMLSRSFGSRTIYLHIDISWLISVFKSCDCRSFVLRHRFVPSFNMLCFVLLLYDIALFIIFDLLIFDYLNDRAHRAPNVLVEMRRGAGASGGLSSCAREEEQAHGAARRVSGG